MRPTSIIYFERLSLLSIMAGLAFTLIDWDDQLAAAKASGLGGASVPIIQGVSLAILLLLIFLISRKAMVAAKWILVTLFAVGLAVSIPQVLQSLDRGLIGLLQLTQLAIQAAALYFLFTPEAREWFAGRQTGVGSIS